MSTSTRPASTPSRHRGDTITTAGVSGLYVGTTAGGVVWIAYEGDDFQTMCAAFDARGERTCDGCHQIRTDVQSVGRDSDGAPDSPDLCGACRGDEGEDEEIPLAA